MASSNAKRDAARQSFNLVAGQVACPMGRGLMPVDRVRVWVLVGVLWTIALVYAASAHAAITDCDPAPTSRYTGSDDAAAQVHALRGEQADDCGAITSRLDREHDDLVAVHDRQADPVAIASDSTSPVHVTNDQSGASTVALSTDDRQQLDDDVNAIRSDLWWFYGALGALVVAYGMWRVFRP